ncbi:MAG: prepilin-type N-terminal cleavage/methylation domain-containing protein, partial [Bacilli bacterium]|nr:prepilin-type N-terminal cleavage/methylation domain-containing protein [Bacilli bacterium]
MKLNRKGYTLIELLAVILIISLIIALSIFGIIKAINSSKGKAATLSEKSIKEAAETYATEKNDDSSYWLDITDKENKYFCITIEELMNKGLLDKKANIESKDFDIHSYVLVKKNKVTMVNSKAEILTEDKDNSDGYKVCMGNIVNEEVTVYPKLSKGNSYTDEIHVQFTDATTNPNSTMSDKVCMYGDSSANIKETGVIEGNTCKLQGLKQNEKYYLRVCMKTSRGSYLCSNTESRSTLQVKKPTYTLSSNTLTIKYNNANINGEAKYYFKSTVKGTSNINVKRCTLSNNIFTCDGNTTTIE